MLVDVRVVATRVNTSSVLASCGASIDSYTPRYPQSSDSRVRARADRATAGAFRARDEADGRRHRALRARELWHRGAARGRVGRERQSDSPQGTPADLAPSGL